MGADGTTVSRLETEPTRTDHDERMTTMTGSSQPTRRLRRPSANAYDIELLQSLPGDGRDDGEGTAIGGTTDIAAKGGIDVEDWLLGPGEGGKAKDPIERLDAVGIGEILDDEGKLKPDEAFQPATDADAHLAGRKPPTGVKLFLLLVALMLVEVLVGLDNTIVATSTATIANDFSALTDVGWYGSAYLLTCVAFQPLAGRAFAFFPQKWVFLSGLVVFELGCVVAAVAQSSAVLILGRAIQGLGYSALFIGILAIASSSLPVRTQAMVTSLMNVCYGTGTVLGPLLGGALTTRLNWRWCFWVSVPPGVGAMLLVVFLCHPVPIPQTLTVRQRLARMDFAGAFILLGAMICLLIALQEGGITSAWSSAKMIGLLVGFGGLMVVFFVLQAYLGDRSSISIRLLMDRSLAAVSFVNFTCGASYYALLYYIPIFFQSVQGNSPVRAGVQLLPLIFMNMFFGILAGWTVSRFGVFHPAMWVGTGLTALGAGLHAALKPDSSDAEWIVFGLIVGAGMGALYMMSFVASQMLTTDPMDKSRAASLVCFFQIFGATAWVSASNSIYANTFKKGISQIPGVDVQAVLDSGVDLFREVVAPDQLDAVIDVSVRGLFYVFISCAVLGAAGFLGVCCIRWVNIGPSGGGKKKKKIDEASLA
ncbi:hypothetical protein BMF94_2687 [Rhodotorula taiwanensis]|uniref:Major facilitator superfamily (MFS) profile domain-containing protein n=1 Tax=Rhodotorula taiwanensis TaxID=741276 RepID=A0A2S5BBU8_9BASI|nr:hypothetical protein BMF94_2687 [Rhodotorula taiwanensis]